MRSTKRDTLTIVLFTVYLLVLVWMVLFKLQFSIPVLENGRVVNLVPFMGSFGENGLFRFGEVRNNIFVFIPFGIYVCMVKGGWSLGRKTLALVALPLALETAQYVFAIGIADITDVLCNALGGLIGVGVYALLLTILKGKTHKVINALAGALTVFALLVMVLLMANNRWIRIR